MILFIFRRDLRLEDNSALIAAAKTGQEIAPCFIFDERSLGSNNSYRSTPAIAFMLSCLKELQESLQSIGGQLYYFAGKAEDVIAKLRNNNKITAIYFNKDYTPFSIERDRSISSLVPCITTDDLLLNPPQSILKDDNTPYTIYTPYMKRARRSTVPQPANTPKLKFYNGDLVGSNSNLLTKYAEEFGIDNNSPRNSALKILKQSQGFINYKLERDYPALSATSQLSPHNKFGAVSIREVYHSIANAHGSEHQLINELYWRDFFTQIAFYYPHVFRGAFKKQYNDIQWQKADQNFERWCAGETGFPIVDAGMRELNTTGFMHNRVRMITAAFLVKDMHINWQEGERYFARMLRDYDPAVNNGNWQWAASTGCDAQPYFRIFNPWLQQQRFDAQCIYIKKWLPELASLNPNEIHNLAEAAPRINNYPAPMFEHAHQANLAIEMFKGSALKAPQHR